MKIAGMQLGPHWHLDDWPDEIHVSHELRPSVSRRYLLEGGAREDEGLPDVQAQVASRAVLEVQGQE